MTDDDIFGDDDFNDGEILDDGDMTGEEYISHIRDAALSESDAAKGQLLLNMIDMFEDKSHTLAMHSQSPSRQPHKIRAEVSGLAGMLSMFPEGVDETLNDVLVKNFGVHDLGRTQNPAGGDVKKAWLAYLIHAVMLTEQLYDAMQVLQNDYGVTSRKQREKLADILCNQIRWYYAGNKDQFYADLAAMPKIGTVEDRFYALCDSNVMKRFGSASNPPKPPSPSP